MRFILPVILLSLCLPALAQGKDESGALGAGKPVPARPEADPAKQGFHINPQLNNVTKTSVTLIWESHLPETGVVEFSGDTSYSQKATEEGTPTLHRVHVNDLQPETMYNYRVTCGEEVFTDHFKTAPATARPITFIVIGDSRRWGNRWAETKMEDHAAQWNAEFYLTMGDLVPSGHNKELWPEHFTRFQGLTGHTWFANARGNHEGSMIFDPESDWFNKYHELPGKGEPFAAFQWGNTYFVMISFEQTMNAWKFLDEELPNVDAKYSVLSHHFPVYCAGYYSPEDSRKEMGTGPMARLAHAIDEHKVTLDLVGHTHIYERQFPIRDRKRNDREGTMFVVNGGDINGQFPEWFTAVHDDRDTMEQPTYTVYYMGDDRVWFRTFAWNKIDKKIEEIDYHIQWQDEAIPKAELAKLGTAQGVDLVKAITDLGAMSYQPAAQPLLKYLDDANADLKRAAAHALCGIGTPEVSNALVAHLNDADVAVRRDLARALEIAMDPVVFPAVLAAAKDPQQDDKARISLLGALQFYGPKPEVTAAMVALLKEPRVPDKVRERVVYTLSQTASESDLESLFDLFRAEQAKYVTTRLAWTLNSLTTDRQSLDGNAPIGQSNPGADREQFIENWKKKLAQKKAA